MADYELIVLTPELKEQSRLAGETKMGGFQTGWVHLKSRACHFVVVENGKYILYVEGYECVPFSENEIEKLVITHERPRDLAAYDRRCADVCRKGIIPLSGPWPSSSVPRLPPEEKNNGA